MIKKLCEINIDTSSGEVFASCEKNFLDWQKKTEKLDVLELLEAKEVTVDANDYEGAEGSRRAGFAGAISEGSTITENASE